MKINEPKVIHDIYGGVLEGKDVVKGSKTLKQTKDLYENSEGVSGDTLVYTVYSYTEGNENQKGNLNWGLSVLEPIYVNHECNMTRGHFHKDRDCAEIYFGVGGEGLLLLMDENNQTWAEKVFKGSLHHIDGHVAHRLINTGDTQLKVGACWPTMAGHDYESIEQQEFGYRVFKEGNDIVVKKR